MIPYPGARAGRSRVRSARDAPPDREPPLVAEKPRLLVIERDTPGSAELRRGLAEHFEVVGTDDPRVPKTRSRLTALLY